MRDKVLNKIITLFVISIFFVSCTEIESLMLEIKESINQHETEYKDGYKNGYKEGNHKGYEEGKLDGYEHGRLDGYNEGQNRGVYCHECQEVRF
jgi:flagellar biosynthesis/type III secretory pathway protein FliH